MSDDQSIHHSQEQRAMREAASLSDNWIHRPEGMRCRTCMYFVPKPGPPPYTEPALTLGGMAQRRVGTLGRCRRHAPTMGGWPVVFESDWCGDHKLDENKI